MLAVRIHRYGHRAGRPAHLMPHPLPAGTP
jgi:hypothetical protein